jgi:hypothetical protein
LTKAAATLTGCGRKRQGNWDGSGVGSRDPARFRWFVGGQTNLGYNAVDRHVLDGHGGRAALIYINERGEREVHATGGSTEQPTPTRQ